MLTDGIEGVKEKVFVLVTGANRYSETLRSVSYLMRSVSGLCF
jgi:hypothetical protein